MQKRNYVTLSVRLDPVDYAKLKQVAKREGRFTSCQARYWLRYCIRDYEAAHGTIRLSTSHCNSTD